MHNQFHSLSLAATFLWFSTSVCSADLILTFDVAVSESEVRLGESVDWHVFVAISEGPADDVTTNNFGIATASFSLVDSRGEVLRPARIGTDFTDYSIQSPGEFFGDQLLGVGVTMFSQSDSAVRGADSGNVPDRGGLGPFLLASGSYTPTEAGTHNLSSVEFDPNEYFTSRGQFIGGGERYADVQFGSAVFSVAAVPEPGSMGLLGAGALMLLRRRARKGIAASR